MKTVITNGSFRHIILKEETKGCLCSSFSVFFMHQIAIIFRFARLFYDIVADICTE